MRISEDERRTILSVLEAGRRFGYGNLIAHLHTAWARNLVEQWDFDENSAREASGPGYPFLMQQDLLERGEWDETGERYRTSG